MHEDFTKRSKFQDLGRWYITRFVEAVARSLPEHAAVLDAGAGECVYRRYFSHCRYTSIDSGVGESGWDYSQLDHVGNLHEMPFDESEFDAVLCTQVLEHLEWPRESVSEMYRVLKPGGKLYLTVPMAQSEHQAPHDYFRYTSYGLDSICRKAGFREIETTPFGGLWVRWAYELPRGLSIFPSSGLRRGDPQLPGIALLPAALVARGMVRLMQHLFWGLDRFDEKKDDPFGWSCVATK